MKSAVRLIACASAIALGAGCAKAGGSTAAGPETLVVAQAWEPQTLDPLLHVDYNAYELDNLVYSMLLQQDRTGRLVPDLAVAVPSLANGQISRDGRRITYRLRPDALWQDGKPVTASDVVFTYRAVMNPRTAVPSRDGYDDVRDIAAPDAHTVVVRLKRPFASFPSFFFAPGQGYPVLPAHLLARYRSLDRVPFNGMPVGSGPYRVVRWIRGERLELAANPTYFAGAPRLARIVIRYLPSETTIVDELRTGEVGASFVADPSDVGFAANDPSLRVRSHPVAGVQYLLMNTASGALHDVRVRRGLAAALDVPYIARVVGRGRFDARDARRGESYWAFDAKVPDIRFDPVEADRLLDAAGWRRGPDRMRVRGGRPLTIQLAYRSGRRTDATIALMVQQEAKARGVAVTLKAYRVERFVAPAAAGGPLYGGTFQAALIDGGFPDPDVSRLYRCDAVPPHGYNLTRYCDPTVDAALRDAAATFDPIARTKAYGVVQRILARDVPAVVMWQQKEIDVVPSRLEGFEPSLMSPYYRANRWRLVHE